MSPPVSYRAADGHLSPHPRPLARDIEWNRLIKDMPVREYCDWVLAGRPGFHGMSPHLIRAWQTDRAKAGIAP